VKGVDPFEISIRGLGWFPSGRRPRVIWAGVEDAGGDVEAIARRLDDGLVDVGIAAEAKQFRPHITLSRLRGAIDTGAVEKAFAGVGRKEFGRETVDEIVLFMSELMPSGAVHSRMGAVSFGGDEKEES